MTEHPLPDPTPVEVGRYERLSQARERALVVAAMELPHWVVRVEEAFALRVEAAAVPAVARELERFEAEQNQQEATLQVDRPRPKVDTLSLYVAAWLLGAFWLAQNLLPPAWLEKGTASSQAIVQQGEWWRALTALTLHGDLSHLLANLATGLLFAGFVLPHLGSGLGWLAIVLSGFLGNLLNAYFYQSVPHLSIGSSTAVFGALGLLVGCEWVERISSPATRTRWQLILPLGGGLALLAFLGANDGETHQTDYMAHLWGLAAGVLLGLLAAYGRLGARLPRAAQIGAACLGPALILAAWVLVSGQIPR